MNAAELINAFKSLSDQDKKMIVDALQPRETVPQVSVDPTVLVEVKGDLKRIFPSASERQLEVMAIKQIERGREKVAPKPPKAGRTYFFRQIAPFRTDSIETETDSSGQPVLKITGEYLPPRVIMVDDFEAWRLYWKRRNKYQYLGRSEGHTWRQARANGLTVAEAQKLEFDAMIKAPDPTAPMNREKTVFMGTKVSQITQSLGNHNEMEWQKGLATIKGGSQ